MFSGTLFKISKRGRRSKCCLWKSFLIMCMWVDYKIEDSRSRCYLFNVVEITERYQFSLKLNTNLKKMHSVFFEFIELLPAMILKTVITDFFFFSEGIHNWEKAKGKKWAFNTWQNYQCLVYYLWKEELSFTVLYTV